MIIDEQYLQWATPRQTEIINAINSEGGYRAAARKLNTAQSNVSDSVKRVKKNAAAAGYSPDHDMTHVVPEGFHVKGVSTYFGEDGKPRGQWVKSGKDKTERTIEALKGAISDLITPIKGTIIPTDAPECTDKDLLCCYPIADAHLGMYAWGEETGEDWDVDISTMSILSSVKNLVDSAPSAETALIENLGDFLHTDSIENKTLRSGHQLDVDTRWARVYRKAARVYREIIKMALTKHHTVILKAVPGNHDDHASFTLAMLMQACFENEPRVTVELPINHFCYHRFGQVLIGMTHGEIKPDKLPLIMATDEREAWGETEHHVFHSGHVHHQRVFEFPGCTVESFRSPSAKDNWTHSKGYRSNRDMVMIKYHRERGEIGRVVEYIN